MMWVSVDLAKVVIAGLDPAIHPFKKEISTMDARVKPAHDESWFKGAAP
jgi:hypothetical protein